MDDGAVRAMLRDAVEELAKHGQPIEEVLEAFWLGQRERTVAVAHALGVLEGAGVIARMTAIELLDEYELLPVAVSPGPARRTRRTGQRASARRGPR